MTTTLPDLDARPDEVVQPRAISRRTTGADAVFANGARIVGASVLVITGSVGLFLGYQALPTLDRYGLDFFTTQVWSPDTDVIGIAAVLVGTFQVALVAMTLAFPLALGTALYISEYAPARIRGTLVSLVDLMAAVPSVIYGLWGYILVMPYAADLSIWFDRTLGWLPIFAVPGGEADSPLPATSQYGFSAFVAGIAVAMMVMPMACAVMRQVFSQTPPGEKEAALALGATRWGMVRSVVLPFGRGGIIGGSMLALGRALGETIAVLLIVSPAFEIKWSITEKGTNTVSSLIAGRFSEASASQLSALLAAGFVLFLITLLINTLAAIVVNRSRSGAENRLMTTTSAPAPEQAAPPAPRTVLPTRDDDAPPPAVRGSLGRLTPDELFVRTGSWAAALGLAWITTQRLLPLTGLAWFLIAWFAFGLLVTAVATLMTGTWVEVKDRVVAALVTGAALLVGAALVSVVVYVAVKGWRPVTNLNFFTQDMAGVGPRDPFDRGGILHAIAGSLMQIGIAIVITLPLGVGTAVFMTEVGGKLARVVRTVVEAMTALPSIVAGLFIYAVWILAVGQPKSGFAASLALSVMVLPIIARAADVVLRVVPGGLREASLALGASRWRTVWHVVLPTARPGLATALILGVARGIGETSPVLLTSGAADFLKVNPFDGSMNSLPLFIFGNVRSGNEIAIERAYGAAFVLLALVLVLFVLARFLARQRQASARRPRRTRTPRTARKGS